MVYVNFIISIQSVFDLKGGNTHFYLKFCWKRLVIMGVSDGDVDKETIVGS